MLQEKSEDLGARSLRDTHAGARLLRPSLCNLPDMPDRVWFKSYLFPLVLAAGLRRASAALLRDSCGCCARRGLGPSSRAERNTDLDRKTENARALRQ